MKWVTRAHVHVDRVACPWLIKRFVDSQAEFIFVAKELVKEIAEKERAIPYDTDGVELGHRDGHCSFISIMENYKLKDPALLAMSEAINAADIDQLSDNPYAPGLEAIARGYSLLYPDDHRNIEKQFEVYDALYAFFKLK